MRYIFATFAAVLIFAGAYLYFYLGVYKEVDLKPEKFPTYYAYFKNHLGPYHKVAPLLIKIEDDFKKMGISCEYTFGHYLDNPEIAPEDRLRAETGCLFTTEQSKFPSDLQFKKVDEAEYVVAKFDGAPSVGPIKVYPEAKKWFKKFGYKFPDEVTEVYQTNGDKVKTQYLFRLAL